MSRKQQMGFTLVETMASLAVLVGVSAIVMTGINRMMTTQGTISNRTEMHTSVRSATELLEQEIGQAGRISLAPAGANVTLAAGVAVGGAVPFTLLPVTAKVFPGEQLVVDSGNNPITGASLQETVTVTGTAAAPTAAFTIIHAANVPVTVLGGFASGVVPPTAAPANYANGSTGTVLKLYGDINGDGNMVYVEYTCQQGTAANPGFLYRNQMAFDAAAKPAVDNSKILLNNVLANPNDPNNNPVPCFSYQVLPSGPDYYVVDVAVTLTEQTQSPDPQTRQFQNETKALLNVSPRNVFYTYQLAGLSFTSRVQPMPASVTNLLP
jgi:type II secretory pathway pseudopilin PulG